MKSTSSNTTVSKVAKITRQETLSRVAPILASALLMGAGVGFVLATILTLALALHVSLGPWWIATAQAHGHVQLYGWAGLFVLGVALHFLPRLPGTPLVMPRLIPWILTALVAGLLLRALSQPLFLVTGSHVWAILLIASGVLECAALVTLVSQLALTARRGPVLATRPAFLGVSLF